MTKLKSPLTSVHARLDGLQGLTGAILALFLLVHIHFESTILLGKEAFFQVVQMLEGGWFTHDGMGEPFVTRVFSLFLLSVLVLHAFAALRRFPTHYRQWRALRQHMGVVQHQDTKLWFWQLITGFSLFFVVPVHLFTMMLNPEIGPHFSAARVVHESAWLLYAILLPAVVFHAVIGMYRLCIKWGGFNARAGARKLAFILLVYLLVMGIFSLLTYVNIGMDLPLDFEPYGGHH
ncbi:fumarate reductase cytochrome b subunit [Paraferrimonas sedimenticola]|uniref:Fumarate reductase n=1 Tax=Paraferrimonas sedimenticola TaxID=375674 RepID=A0AA37W038_9GAMM|nr:fumarate reductase cytochrome b subunit [Paraferrimonas sedimenticola]GLP95875.1 fumarate reductase [Paraferrimonas sedimenticola]